MLNCNRVVGVAQLVERRSVAPKVAGSNPVSHPNLTMGFDRQLDIPLSWLPLSFLSVAFSWVEYRSKSVWLSPHACCWLGLSLAAALRRSSLRFFELRLS